MIAEKLKIDLTEIGEKKSRDSFKNLIHSEGISFTESESFWSHFESDESPSIKNTIVFADLSHFVKSINKINQNTWEYKVNKVNPYFISLIRGNKDRLLANNIDKLVKSSGERFTVIDATLHLKKASLMISFTKEFQNIITKNFNPDSLKHIAVNKSNKSFLIDYNDGSYGEVSFNDLGIIKFLDNLLIDSAKISKTGNAIEIFTQDGEIFDIDADVLKSFISEDVRNKINREAQITAVSIGASISIARKEKNITQKELSITTEIDQAIISKIENGKHIPRFDTIERIAKGLNINIEKLLSFYK